MNIFCECGGQILESIGCNYCGKHKEVPMLCYKDKTFCTSKSCKNKECTRQFTDELARDAEAFSLPIALCDFSNTCVVYKGS